MKTSGSIPEIIRNSSDVYEGNLIEYFKIVFRSANNLRNPYHNFRHMFHVLWLCYQACIFYGDRLTKREKRNLLIAALFHDFNHTGTQVNDDINIMLATRGLMQFILNEDRTYFMEIIELIKCTEYPYKTPSGEIGLMQQVIRDADLGQVFSTAWIQQVVFGLATEWNREPLDILKIQAPFLRYLRFYSEWGQEMFPESVIKEKIDEANEILGLLTDTGVQ